jgi:cob(I)alamin adenosyltransferase
MTEINLTDPEKPTTDRPAEPREKKKEKGLIIIHTGDGKGKSSSAIGMVVRSAIHGFKVGVVQFIKGKWKTAEQKLPDLFPGLIDWHVMGEGFTWVTQNRGRDVEVGTKAWELAKEMILSGKYRLILLDEINYALQYEFLPLADVVETLKRKDPNLHVILTGRNAKPELIEIADLVTEMKEVKHPYKEQGIVAQRGIEF